MEDQAFSDALREAIRASGLGLQRIRAKLHERGVSLSIATLSYWTSNRSHPERRESLVAVAHLEEILQLPAGALTSRLGPPRPRGRVGRQAVELPPVMALWPRSDELAVMVRELDTQWDQWLTRISQYDRVEIGADRGERSYLSRQVLRAEMDGPDRWVVLFHLDEHGHELPVIRAVRHCRVGQVIARAELGLVVAELLFDRPLRRGETVITEHEVVNRAPYPVDGNYERKFRLPAREFVLEVCFAVVPRWCERYFRPVVGEEVVQSVEVGGGGVHLVELDLMPGCYGFRWGF